MRLLPIHPLLRPSLLPLFPLHRPMADDAAAKKKATNEAEAAAAAAALAWPTGGCDLFIHRLLVLVLAVYVLLSMFCTC